MSVRPIVRLGHPALRVPAQPVRVDDLVSAIERIGAQRFGTGDGKSRKSVSVAIAGFFSIGQ